MKKFYQCDESHSFATELSEGTVTAPCGETVYAENHTEAMKFFLEWERYERKKK